MAIWEQICETIIREIEAGILGRGVRLPGDVELAARFGVNRHTVRRALDHLQAQGLVRAERGRGTFVSEDPVLYNFGSRTRFEQNLLANMRVPTRRVISMSRYPSPTSVSEDLECSSGSPLLMVSLLGEADATPVHYSIIHISLEKFPSAEAVFSRIPKDKSLPISLSEIMTELGTPEFQRRSTRIKCRLPGQNELRYLRITKYDPLIQLNIINVDCSNSPVFVSNTAYPGGRVEFFIDHDI